RQDEATDGALVRPRRDGRLATRARRRLRRDRLATSGAAARARRDGGPAGGTRSRGVLLRRQGVQDPDRVRPLQTFDLGELLFRRGPERTEDLVAGVEERHRRGAGGRG